MNKKELSKRLQVRRLPEHIDIYTDTNNEHLTIKLGKAAICDNMQNDAAAFEGWGLCILSKLNSVKKIVIDWEDIDSEVENGHYNRFLYRLHKMMQYFGDIFTIEQSKRQSLDLFVKEYYNSNNLVLNYPNSEATKASNIKSKDSEAYIEARFQEDKIFDHFLDVADRQLPVGVFKGNISKEASMFTYGHSAIDLWGIKDDALYIFELKKSTNKKVGIISEALFYLWVMSDTINKKFKYETIGSIPQYRNFNRLYSAIEEERISKIKSVLLIEELHPLVSKGTLYLINSRLNRDNLEMSTQYYKYENDKIELIQNDAHNP